MQSGIYQIVNVVNGKTYIGSSKALKSRRYTHFRELRKGSHVNPHLLHAWQECGAAAFHFSVLEYCSRDELLERERWWMNLLGARERAKGYNLWDAERHECAPETRAKLSASLIGNEHCKGRVPWNKGLAMTDETKARVSASTKAKGVKRTEAWKAAMSARMKGSAHPMSGKAHTPEAREKIRKARAKQAPYWLGRKRSPETIAKMSAGAKGHVAWNKGIPISEEQKAKQAAAMKGRVPPNKGKKGQVAWNKGLKRGAPVVAILPDL